MNQQGFHWMDNGQSVFSGELLQAFRRVDALFLEWSAGQYAEEFHFPIFIPASELHKLDYFRSFPHLITFPVVLQNDDSNLKKFTSGNVLNERNELQLTEPAGIRDVLTPAACYHFYIHFQKRALDKPLYLTTCCRCFRRESYYAPLQRQWCFTMREIVCIGTADEAKTFTEGYRERIDQFFHKIGLPIEWKDATDPFFNASQNPKYLAQRLDPVKTEMVFGENLAIGSINLHRNYFGEAFQIDRGGQEAFSACVAFGLERWMYALLNTFGEDPSRWPV